MASSGEWAVARGYSVDVTDEQRRQALPVIVTLLDGRLGRLAAHGVGHVAAGNHARLAPVHVLDAGDVARVGGSHQQILPDD